MKARLSKITLIPLLLLCAVQPSCNNTGDVPEKTFLKYIGKSGNQSAADIIVNSAGAALIAGTSKANIDKPSQPFLTFLSNEGVMIWEYYFPTTESGFNETAIDIEMAPGGQSIVLLSAIQSQNFTSFRLYKFDINTRKIENQITVGKLQTPAEDRSYAPISVSYIKGAPSLREGYIVVGSYQSSGRNYQEAFEKYFNADLTSLVSEFQSEGLHIGMSNAISVKAFPYQDSAILIFGYSSESVGKNPITNNYWWFLVNRYGTPINSKTFNRENPNQLGIDNTDEYLRSVVYMSQAPGEGYFMSGVSNRSGIQEYRPYFVKIGSQVNFTDTDVIFNSFLDDDDFRVRHERNAEWHQNLYAYPSLQGGVLVMAARYTGPQYDVIVARLNENCTRVIWTKNIGSIDMNTENFSGGISELPDGRVIALGTVAIGTVFKQTKIVYAVLDKDGYLK